MTPDRPREWREQQATSSSAAILDTPENRYALIAERGLLCAARDLGVPLYTLETWVKVEAMRSVQGQRLARMVEKNVDRAGAPRTLIAQEDEVKQSARRAEIPFFSPRRKKNTPTRWAPPDPDRARQIISEKGYQAASKELKLSYSTLYDWARREGILSPNSVGSKNRASQKPAASTLPPAADLVRLVGGEPQAIPPWGVFIAEDALGRCLSVVMALSEEDARTYWLGAEVRPSMVRQVVPGVNYPHRVLPLVRRIDWPEGSEYG